MLFRSWRSAVLVAVLLLVHAPVSKAFDPIQFGYTAEITSITNLGDLPALSVGSVFTGRYVFDADAPAPTPSPGSGSGQFLSAMILAEADLQGQPFYAKRTPDSIETLTQIQTHDYDIEPILPEGELYRAGLESVAGGDLTDFVVFLQHPGPSTGIMGTELPLLPPDPAAFDTATLLFITAMGSSVGADLLILPEPGGVASALAAGLAIALLGRRRPRTP